MADELSAEGGEVAAWQYDQSDETTIAALVTSVMAHFGGLDGVFANVADIQAVMDRGVMGVQVPHIITRADAERAVAAVKFGPEGKRGLAAATRPDRWGIGGKMTDFIGEANSSSLVCVQIEDQEALANVDEIL